MNMLTNSNSNKGIDCLRPTWALYLFMFTVLKRQHISPRPSLTYRHYSSHLKNAEEIIASPHTIACACLMFPLLHADLTTPLPVQARHVCILYCSVLSSQPSLSPLSPSQRIIPKFPRDLASFKPQTMQMPKRKCQFVELRDEHASRLLNIAQAKSMLQVDHSQHHSDAWATGKMSSRRHHPLCARFTAVPIPYPG